MADDPEPSNPEERRGDMPPGTGGRPPAGDGGRTRSSPGGGTPGRSGEDADAGRMIGPYRLLEELGRGSQGSVFLAEDVRLSRRVALKVLASEGGTVALPAGGKPEGGGGRAGGREAPARPGRSPRRRRPAST